MKKSYYCPFGKDYSWEYNDPDASHVGNSADGSAQLSADQSGGFRIGCGLETSGVLPAWWKACLRDDGESIGAVVGSHCAG